MTSKNNLLELRDLVRRKTSMPVSGSQLKEFVSQFHEVKAHSFNEKCEMLKRNDNFVPFTDFMVERTDIPLFKS